MYSPKIHSDLIPVLYRLAKSKNKPMTRIVNDILRAKLDIKEDKAKCEEPKNE